MSIIATGWLKVNSMEQCVVATLTNEDIYVKSPYELTDDVDEAYAIRLYNDDPTPDEVKSAQEQVLLVAKQFIKNNLDLLCDPQTIQLHIVKKEHQTHYTRKVCTCP